MKTYVIKKTVIEMYSVKANSKKEALVLAEDPYSVTVKSERIISAKKVPFDI